MPLSHPSGALASLWTLILFTLTLTNNYHVCWGRPLASNSNIPLTVGQEDGDSGMIVQTNDTSRYAADFELKVRPPDSQLMPSPDSQLTLSLNIAPMNSVPENSMTTVDGVTQLCGGNLLLMNASSQGAIDWTSIPVISCDDPATTNANLQQVLNGNPPCIIMYSLLAQGCNFSKVASSQGMQLGTVFSMLSEGTAHSLVHQLSINGGRSQGTIVPNFPNSSQNQNQDGDQAATSKPMIVLYVIVGVIAVAFLTLIVMGAVRAHKHPERYGFVTTAVDQNNTNRPSDYEFGSANSQYTNRAKGLARAVLDSVPLVRWRLDEKQVSCVGTGASKDAPCKEMNEKPSSVVDGTSGLMCCEVKSQVSSETYRPSVNLSECKHNHKLSSTAQRQNSTTTNLSSSSSDSSQGSPTVANVQVCSAGGHSYTYPQDLPEYSEPDATDNNAACLICFDDFKDGDVLRVLPCNHKFHALCVDQWLLNSSVQCPLCRLDVSIQRNEPISEEPPIETEGMEVDTSILNRFLDFWNAQLLPREARRQALAQFHREAELRRQIRQRRDIEHREQNRRRWAQFVLSRRIAHLTTLRRNDTLNHDSDTAQH